MRRRSRPPRPTPTNRNAQFVAIVLMGIVLFIVIKFRNSVADNISSVFDAMGGAASSDLEVPGGDSPKSDKQLEDAPDAGVTNAQPDAGGKDAQNERSVTP